MLLIILSAWALMVADAVAYTRTTGIESAIWASLAIASGILMVQALWEVTND
jgi:hypothetical protein